MIDRVRNWLHNASDEQILAILGQPQINQAPPEKVHEVEGWTADQRAGIVELLLEEYLFRFGTCPNLDLRHHIQVIARLPY